MKILHIVSGLQKASGVTTFVENVVAELRTLGHEVDVVTRADEIRTLSLHLYNSTRLKIHPSTSTAHFNSPSPSTSRFNSSSLHLYNSTRLNPFLSSTSTSHFNFSPSNSTRLNKIRIDKIKAYDIVHIHGLWEPWLHGWARTARKAGVKVVWSPHGMLTPWALRYKGLKKKIAWLLYQKRDLQNAAAIHVTVSSEEADVRRVGLTNKVIVVPLGVRMDGKLKIENEELRIEKGECKIKGEESHILLFVSRVQKKKGLRNLIEALKPLSFNGWRLRIVGLDQEGHTAELKALAQREGVADRIDFVGPKYGEELEKEYLNADCFILPSFSENFGSVVVEAMAAGLPVIAAKGTPWQELEVRECGWWIENDPETLARTIAEMMSLTDEERRAMGARGRQLVAEKYQWPAIGRKMAEAYGEVLGIESDLAV